MYLFSAYKKKNTLILYCLFLVRNWTGHTYTYKWSELKAKEKKKQIRCSICRLKATFSKSFKICHLVLHKLFNTRFEQIFFGEHCHTYIPTYVYIHMQQKNQIHRYSLTPSMTFFVETSTLFENNCWRPFFEAIQFFSCCLWDALEHITMERAKNFDLLFLGTKNKNRNSKIIFR